MARPRSAGYDDQREQILAAAAQLFATRGYTASTMHEVAAACGVSKATLYHYVRDKHHLLAQITRGHVERLEALVQAVQREGLAPEALLRALIRRASGNASSELTAGDIRLDTRSGKVTRAGEPVKLTAQEYKLLSYLMHHKGKVVSRTELIEHIYDQDFDRDSNTIEVFVTRIRKKLGQDVITTIRGLGYSLDEPGAPAPVEQAG